jgi:hypothetical protein
MSDYDKDGNQISGFIPPMTPEQLFEAALNHMKEVNVALVVMTPEQRIALLGAFFDGYCRACGNEEPKNGHCQCENDE